MNCFKLSLGLALLILLFLVHNKYYLVNVVLCSIVIVLLLNQVVNYERFQTSIEAKDFLKLTNNDTIENEQQKQEIMISNLENKLRLMKTRAQERQVENEAEGGILIENSCNVEAEPQEENVPQGNIKVMSGLDVKAAEFGNI